MSFNVNPLVTIAIPTFNRASGNLASTVQSAVNQAYKNIEIIVSDNCSSDHTEQVIKQFGTSRIQYIRHPENIGANANFNFCISQAKGEYFLLLHDDDLIDDDFVATCMETRSKTVNEVGIIRTGTRWIDEAGKVLAEKPNLVSEYSTEDFFIAYCTFKASSYLCSTLFNTMRLKEMGGFHSKYNLFQDVMAVAKLSALFGRQDIFDVKASNRKHPGERTFSVKIGDWCEESVLLIDMMCELVPNRVTELRDAGKNFIFQHNYNLAKNIHGIPQRLGAYLEICKACGYLYSLKRIGPAASLLRLMKLVVRGKP